MSEKYPRIRSSLVIEDETAIVLQEGLNLTFYVQRPHEEIAQAVQHSLDIYCRAIRERTLGYYVDYHGDWPRLDDKGWARIHQRLLDPRGASIELCEKSDSVTGYAFKYRGRGTELPYFYAHHPHATCAVAFWLPTEFLEEHGPARVRELALELGAALPFSSGHAGIALEIGAWMRDLTPLIQDKGLRHPGIDIPRLEELSLHLGTRVRGPSWLTFLGQPVLGELGGAAGLRAQLRSPDTSVQELEGDRVVVTLGKEPEAGDLEQGLTLPHYRELARVLEPWLYAHQGSWGFFDQEDIRRIERRFLD